MKKEKAIKLYQIKNEILVLITKRNEITVIDSNDPTYDIVNKDGGTIIVNSQFEKNLDLAIEDWIAAIDEGKIKERIMKKVGL
jgi:hypothetical protein